MALQAMAGDAGAARSLELVVAAVEDSSAQSGEQRDDAVRGARSQGPSAIDPCTGALASRFQWRQAPMTCALQGAPVAAGASVERSPRLVPIQLPISTRSGPPIAQASAPQ